MARNQDKQNDHGGSQDQDQHYKRANEKREKENERANEKRGDEIKRANQKQMTYREALLGLDNSEPSSDF